MAEPGILVAKVNALLFHGDRRLTIRKGVTTIREGHPLLAGREHLFEPWSITLDYDPNEAPESAPGADEPQAAGQPDAKAVRAWAAANGIEVSPKGKLPQDVIDQYLAAQGA